MTSPLSPLRRLEHFLASRRGKRILNYFYSWGAAFVILGALFKLLHIRYGDEIIFASMLTEVFVFIVLGFERPEQEEAEQQSAPMANNTPIATRQVESAPLQHVPQSTSGVQEYTDLEGLTEDLTAIQSLYARQLTALQEQLTAMEQINRDLQHMRSMYAAGAQDSTTVRQQNEQLINQLEQLNAAYARMLQAMTVNMRPFDSQESAVSPHTK